MYMYLCIPNLGLYHKIIDNTNSFLNIVDQETFIVNANHEN